VNSPNPRIRLPLVPVVGVGGICTAVAAVPDDTAPLLNIHWARGCQETCNRVNAAHHCHNLLVSFPTAGPEGVVARMNW